MHADPPIRKDSANAVSLGLSGRLPPESDARRLPPIARHDRPVSHFFVHFAQPDHLGHKHGEASQQYSDGIKEDDLWTGKIVTALKELAIHDKTLVYVVVDHGFNVGESGHRYAPYVFLATNDKRVNRNGVREDIAPTVLKRFGVDLTKIEPKLDGIPLDEPAPPRKAPAENPNPRRAAAKT